MSPTVPATARPRAARMRPREAAVMPLPSEEVTPPVTNTNFGTADLRGFSDSRVIPWGREGCAGRRDVVDPLRSAADTTVPLQAHRAGHPRAAHRTGPRGSARRGAPPPPRGRRTEPWRRGGAQQNPVPPVHARA